ncbi:VanZ family protein [Subsaxibacter sp. CAU 1640]|uniref:VanZ family protein n=1 Tax=Subsaxibacter sp. CAU 1640 TaxID=2933271 RepID=UPI002005AD84|nr:VanZ family protein [Subsaxibacter sp. CAU 1640]MCK7589799.1 VanZ family protein [Subsaxibacter sp. CAU 1640]
MHKRVALLIAVCYTFFITYLSLKSLQKIPKLGSSFDDKIYHFGAYTLFVLVWYHYFEKTSIRLKILLSAMIAFIYGIIVEVLQGTFTTYRTEDIADVFANSLGVVFAILLVISYRQIKLK